MHTATNDIYTCLHTLSLHDALPIFEDSCRSCPHNLNLIVWRKRQCLLDVRHRRIGTKLHVRVLDWAATLPSAYLRVTAMIRHRKGHSKFGARSLDRKSTRMNSSH